MRAKRYSMTAGMTAIALASAGFPAPAAAAKKPPSGTFESIQVAVGDCATRGAEFFGPIISALLGTAISKGVNKIGTALQAAGNAKTWKATGSRNIDVEAKEFGKCVQVVRGRFFTKPPSLNQKPADLETVVGNGWLTLVRNGLYVAAQPDFFFEGVLDRPRVVPGALTVTPLYAKMTRPIGTRMLRPGKSRHVALFMTFFAPDTAALVTEDNAAAAVVLGEMQPGVALDFRAPPAVAAVAPAPAQLNSLPAFPTVGAQPSGSFAAGNDTPITPGGWVRPPGEAPWFRLALDETAQPLTLGVLLTETQGANGFVKFLGEVLGSEAVTGAVTTQLRNEIVPADRETARAAEATKAATLVSEYETAVVTALDKTLACSTGTPTGEAVNEARTALRTLNSKAKAKGLEALPVGDTLILAIRPVDEAATINDACVAARNVVVAYARAQP
jgi:hypothetical protein